MRAHTRAGSYAFHDFLLAGAPWPLTRPSPPDPASAAEERAGPASLLRLGAAARHRRSTCLPRRHGARICEHARCIPATEAVIHAWQKSQGTNPAQALLREIPKKSLALARAAVYRASVELIWSQALQTSRSPSPSTPVHIFISTPSCGQLAFSNRDRKLLADWLACKSIKTVAYVNTSSTHTHQQFDYHAATHSIGKRNDALCCVKLLVQAFVRA